MTDPGPFKVEPKGAGRVINAPGMIITADKAGKVSSIGIEAIAAQLNRAHEAGRLEGRKQLDDEETKLSATYAAQRDGWRSIAEALIAIGMGYQMRGFGDTPPREILDDLCGTTETAKDWATGKETVVTTPPRADEEIMGAIRDSLTGRAWRVRGSQGAGTCDYPLCPNRARKVTPTGYTSVSMPGNVKLHICGSNQYGENALTECHRWAQWVEQRARGERIEVAK